MGVTLVEVGYLGYPGAGGTMPWQLEEAITDRTAAVACPIFDTPGTLSLPEVAEIAHARGVPVIVDAAAELPPRTNLRRFISEGADLVTFSGGKAIGGPQSSGILAGRADLIASVALQHQDMDVRGQTWNRRSLIGSGAIGGVPHQGLGRSLKVGREEIVGLVTALERYAAGSDDDDARVWTERLDIVAAALGEIDGVVVTRRCPPDRPIPVLVLTLDEDRLGLTAYDVVTDLLDGSPPVAVTESRAEHHELSVNAMGLTDGEAESSGAASASHWPRRARTACWLGRRPAGTCCQALRGTRSSATTARRPEGKGGRRRPPASTPNRHICGRSVSCPAEADPAAPPLIDRSVNRAILAGMGRELSEVFFVDGVRTAFGKAGPGRPFWRTRADDMAVKAVRELLRRNPRVPPERIGDVIFAATAQVGDQGLTLGRDVALLAGLPHTVPGFAVDRMCAGALTATTAGAGEIAIGAADLVARGRRRAHGPPRDGRRGRLQPALRQRAADRRVRRVMGQTAENLHDPFPAADEGGRRRVRPREPAQGDRGLGETA